MPPTCRARTCTPRGSTTNARSPCPCTGTATTALCHHASSAFHFPSLLKPPFFFLMFIIFIDFCFFFSLKFMYFSKWSSVCGYFAVDFALFHSSQLFIPPLSPHLASSPGTWCCGHCGDGPENLGTRPGTGPGACFRGPGSVHRKGG